MPGFSLLDLVYLCFVYVPCSFLANNGSNPILDITQESSQACCCCMLDCLCCRVMACDTA